MHTENVSDDGEITDGGELSVATYYSPCVGVMNADGYLRVVCDAPGHYTETRVDHATMEHAGWYLDADDLVGRSQMAETAMTARVAELETQLAAARKALTVCDGAMIGKVKPSSVAFKMIRAIMYPENANAMASADTQTPTIPENEH